MPSGPFFQIFGCPVRQHCAPVALNNYFVLHTIDSQQEEERKKQHNLGKGREEVDRGWGLGLTGGMLKTA
jgi:hypothetical protein